MAENSKIEWCDHTVNLWWGCTKVHTGCKNCYAEYFSDTRHKKNLWGANSKRQLIKSAFNDLDKYQKNASAENKYLKIFCGSMMDIFEDSKELNNPNSIYNFTAVIRQELFSRIDAGKYNNLIFLFLTKRPQNIVPNIPIGWLTVKYPVNVWFGTSISDQKTADQYIPLLPKISSMNLFLSVEPQVDSIDILLDLIDTNIKWVIQGGESGHNKRHFDISWAYSLKNQCELSSVAYFFKQIDKVSPIPDDLKIRQFPDFKCN